MRVGNVPIRKIVNACFGEYGVNNNCKNLRDFCTYNNWRLKLLYFHTKRYIKLFGLVQEGLHQNYKNVSKTAKCLEEWT